MIARFRSFYKPGVTFHGTDLEFLGLVCLRTGLVECSAEREDLLAESRRHWDLVSSSSALTVLAVLHI